MDNMQVVKAFNSKVDRDVVNMRPTQLLMSMLIIGATCYTALFAILAARGLPISYGLVVLAEIGIIGLGILVIVITGISIDDLPVIVLVYWIAILAVLLSIYNDRLMVENIRSILLIGVFCLIGQRSKMQTVDQAFFIVAILALSVLILEIGSVKAYVAVFEPQSFFAATRGIEASEYNNTGLFNNTEGFSGRFSFGLFAGNRTSSIFLEQVSNANFACVLSLYLLARWRHTSIPKRLLFATTIVLILVTTNARFASLFTLSVTLGAYIFPKLSRFLRPLLAIGVALVIAGVSYVFWGSNDDDLVGRIVHTGRAFESADLAYFFGGDIGRALSDLDTGYGYVVGTSTIFGMLALWVFVSFYPRANDAVSRRLAWGVAIYFFGQLVVTGTSLFSIKTAALLWSLVGCIRQQEKIVTLAASRKAE